MSSYELRITDRNGCVIVRELAARSRAQAWDAYTELWDNNAITQVDLLRDGAVIDRTEHKLMGTPGAYRKSGTLPKREG